MRHTTIFGGARSPTSLSSGISGPRLTPPSENYANTSALPNKNFFCLMAFVVALAELGASLLQAASSDSSTNSYQANPANKPLTSQIQPTNQFIFKSAAEAEAQALAVSDWMSMVRSKREEPQVQMRIHDSGATAQGGAHRLDLDGNLNVRHAVRIVMADKQEMEGHVVSLAASDASGQRVWLGQVKDCVGEQIPGTTQVIYRDAFESIKADVIVGYGLNSVEQFVVFRERFELPATIAASTARLEAWTEWFQAPEPKKKEKQITLRQGNNQDDIVDVDEELDFGLMRMIDGKAFMMPVDSSRTDVLASGSTNATSKKVQESIPVQKRWVESGGRRFLVESVDYQALKSLLDQLPARQSSVKPSRKSTNPQALPALTPVQSSRTALLAQLTPSPSPLLDSPGVVLDYELVYSSLLNIQFGNSIGRKVGGAAVDRTTGDYWNWYVHPGDMTATMTNLLWSHEVGSPINMTVLNAPGQWGNTTGDAMFDGYIYNDVSLPITIGFSGIPAGSYDLYLYGHGAADTQYGRFEPVLGGSSCGIQQTAVSACWHQAVGTWTNGVHYVRYGNLVVGADGYLTVNVLLDGDGYPIINGLQLAAAPLTSGNGSTFVSHTIPMQMAPSQSYNVSVTMRNTGTATWNTAQYYRLGSQNPQDNQTWGLNRVSLPNSVTSGLDVTFNFTVTAPSTPGVYNCQWRMVQDGVAWFGAYTPNVAVAVAVVNGNSAPVVEAGTNQTVDLKYGAVLNSSVTDDGQPYGSTVSMTWSKYSGPGTVTFGTPHAFATTASFSVAGSYVLRLTATDGLLSSSDTVTITVNTDSDHDGLPDSIDAYPNTPDTTAPTFTITSPNEGAILP